MSATASTIDLHVHTNCSDGVLTPAAVVIRAAGNGVRVLAITDHDTTAGLDEARTAAAVHGVALVPGVEVSAQWSGGSLHVVGLFVDPACRELRDGLADIRDLRAARAEEMARRLAGEGLVDPWSAVAAEAGPAVPTRAHFARALVAQGMVPDMARAFRRYLGAGRPGHVRAEWPPMEQVVRLIHDAGGLAVLAHPFAYRLGSGRMARLLTAFRSAAGDGIEVVCGGGGPGAVDSARHFARRFELAASMGSDFHDPAAHWNDIGRLRPLPGDVTPVWAGRIE